MKSHLGSNQMCVCVCLCLLVGTIVDFLRSDLFKSDAHTRGQFVLRGIRHQREELNCISSQLLRKSRSTDVSRNDPHSSLRVRRPERILSFYVDRQTFYTCHHRVPLVVSPPSDGNRALFLPVQRLQATNPPPSLRDGRP